MEKNQPNSNPNSNTPQSPKKPTGSSTGRRPPAGPPPKRPRSSSPAPGNPSGQKPRSTRPNNGAPKPGEKRPASQKSAGIPVSRSTPPREQPLPKKPDPSTNHGPLQSSYHKETDEEIRSKPPTGTPEYPYYKGSLATARIRIHPGLRRTFSILLTTIMSLFLICIITGTIVVTALTVYVMDFRDEVSAVTIEELELQYNTYVYANDAEGNEICLYEVNNDSERVPVEIKDIPQHVRDAFVYAEDGRFYTHDGVDYKRTFYSFVNMFVHIYDTNIGGSTITQQLVKNITGDNVQSPSRKIREIFRAMELEQNYSKDEILESYLNYIGFGGATNGVQGASLKYFGKSVSELSVAEAACLAAIPKSPETINPFAGYEDEETGEWINIGKENNRVRQIYVLEQMYENGAITYDEFQAAMSEPLIFTDSEEYQAAHPDEEENAHLESSVTSWIVDTAIYEVAAYLEEMYNISTLEAVARINDGGYRIYTTVDMDMQNYVEEKYKDLDNLMLSTSVAHYGDPNGDGQYTVDEIEYPQSAFIAMNYDGSIRAIVGSVGEKTIDLGWNYATMEPRQPGSTIKPLTTYGLALENDKIHWGTMIEDSPLTQVGGQDWPINYGLDSSSGNYSMKDVPAYQALAQSLNTVSAKICYNLSPQSVFNFATEKMGLELSANSPDGLTDNAISPLSVGALTYGVTLENLVAGYIPYGNGGTYYNPHIVSKVVQGTDTTIYEDDGSPRRVVSEETAYVMNKMLQNVVSDGTGSAAQLGNKHVAGKTGTAEDWVDLSFVGLTEDFVSGVWIGYTGRYSLPSSLKSAQVWYNIIGEYANSIDSGASYPACDSVITGNICQRTGKIAGTNCPTAGTGYWKSSNAPVCEGCWKYTTTTTKKTTESAAASATTYTETVAPPADSSTGGEVSGGGDASAGGESSETPAA
ncbi:MAG: transglycosylase domain-containing protein [Ruminococcus sp.]|nr:transglycosylase domain-containing protein [Ruminococcus sp.]